MGRKTERMGGKEGRKGREGREGYLTGKLW
jgi:hypothetical protein